MSEQRFSGWHGPTTGDLHGRKAFADSAAYFNMATRRDITIATRGIGGELVPSSDVNGFRLKSNWVSERMSNTAGGIVCSKLLLSSSRRTRVN